MAQYTFFFEDGKIGNLIRIYGPIILDEKQNSSYLPRMTSKKVGFFHQSYVTAVVTTIMTFQIGGYFDLRAIKLENYEFGDPNFYFIILFLFV